MSAAASVRQPVLERNEWSLVVELLERESRDLPLEIHRTATRERRDVLRERLSRVEILLERLRPQAT